jgi:hypothetical protein
MRIKAIFFFSVIQSNFKEILKLVKIYIFTYSMIRDYDTSSILKSKAVPLHAMEALGGRGGIAPTHS